MSTHGSEGGSAPSPSKVARMIELAESQLLALTMERSDINARAMGVVAADAALGALFVAGKAQLGPHIRIALLGLVISAVTSFVATRPKPEVGPRPGPLLTALDATDDREFDVALLGHLRHDLSTNSRASGDSALLLLNALTVTLVTVGYCVYLALLSRHHDGRYYLSLTP